MSECCIDLALFNCDWGPDDIIHLGRLALFVILLSPLAKRQWDPEAGRRTIFLLLLLWYCPLFKWINMLMLGHVKEDLTASLHILGLDNEPLPWLDGHTSFRVHHRLPISRLASCHIGHAL